MLIMKAFEVEVSIRSGYRGETATYFVQAESKKQLLSLDNVLKVWARGDIHPSDCDMEICENLIVQKNSDLNN